MALIGINYDGGNTYDEDGNVIENEIIYEGVTLNVFNQNHLFKSGNFVKDWYDAKKMYLEFSLWDPRFSISSSVNHFIMDGAPYSSAYLHIENNVLSLKYTDESDDSYIFTQNDIFENGWEMFVPLGTQPTYEEYLEIVK